MNRPENLNRILVILICLGVILIPLAARINNEAIDIHARMAESGGWSPKLIKAEVGTPVHLHLTSDDVVHGFAVGQMDMNTVDILPGKVTNLTLTFDKPGTYTFYCTRWCGLNHWRMRGTIEVSGSDSPEPADSALGVVEASPLYVKLGLDIDAPHPAQIMPELNPSAMRGSQFAQNLTLSTYKDIEYYRSHSPAQAFTDMRADPDLQLLSDSQIWDIVAYLWQSQVTSGGFKEGERLYAQNCAACHGENGAGDGVFADDLESAGTASSQTMNSADMAMQTPADFSDSERMLGASPALLQGKLLRGGMGTGMPMWGAIFTDEQSWNIIAYLYTFQFTEVAR